MEYLFEFMTYAFAFFAGAVGFAGIFRREYFGNVFLKMWVGIVESGWLQMPERVIEKLIKSVNKRIEIVLEELTAERKLVKAERLMIRAVTLASSVIGVLLVVIILARQGEGKGAAVFAVVLAVGAIIYVNLALTIGTITLTFAGTIVLIGLLTNSLIQAKALAGAFVLSLAGVELGRIEKAKKYILIPLGFFYSFSITLLAFRAGIYFCPAAWAPKTSQMLIVNALCDGITVVATLSILTRALESKKAYAIPFAILYDLLVAALLAMCSLYFGLVFTHNALSIQEVFNILIFRSPDGDHLEFGPYFWAMHTTFLPTAAYLLIILAAWLGKMFLIPVEWFFRKGYEHGPVQVTVAFLAATGGLFKLFSFMAKFAQKYMEHA